MENKKTFNSLKPGCKRIILQNKNGNSSEHKSSNDSEKKSSNRNCLEQTASNGSEQISSNSNGSNNTADPYQFHETPVKTPMKRKFPRQYDVRAVMKKLKLTNSPDNTPDEEESEESYELSDEQSEETDADNSEETDADNLAQTTRDNENVSETDADNQSQATRDKENRKIENPSHGILHNGEDDTLVMLDDISDAQATSPIRNTSSLNTLDPTYQEINFGTVSDEEHIITSTPTEPCQNEEVVSTAPPLLPSEEISPIPKQLTEVEYDENEIESEENEVEYDENDIESDENEIESDENDIESEENEYDSCSTRTDYSSSDGEERTDSGLFDTTSEPTDSSTENLVFSRTSSSLSAQSDNHDHHYEDSNYYSHASHDSHASRHNLSLHDNTNVPEHQFEDEAHPSPGQEDAGRIQRVRSGQQGGRDRRQGEHSGQAVDIGGRQGDGGGEQGGERYQVLDTGSVHDDGRGVGRGGATGGGQAADRGGRGGLRRGRGPRIRGLRRGRGPRIRGGGRGGATGGGQAADRGGRGGLRRGGGPRVRGVGRGRAPGGAQGRERAVRIRLPALEKLTMPIIQKKECPLADEILPSLSQKQREELRRARKRNKIAAERDALAEERQAQTARPPLEVRPGVRPLQNFEDDWEDPEDYENGWLCPPYDEGPSIFPFLSENITGLMCDPGDGTPYHFFKVLFDDRMWETMRDETNKYGARHLNRLLLGLMRRRGARRPPGPSSRQHKWKPISVGDLKTFFALECMMGLVRKSRLEDYWNQGSLVDTPTFGKYMSRNFFQLILSNLHLADNILDDKTNPLHKIQPFLDMCKRNFRGAYYPERDLCVDEACIAFKGLCRFLTYNPRKPNRFHIKNYTLCESSSGYVIDFEVYEGKKEDMQSPPLLDPDCNKTTQVVMRMLEKNGLLDVGHHVYTDNYYTSRELAAELAYRHTYFCGTIRASSKGYPEACRSAALLQGESVFRRCEETGALALKWRTQFKEEEKVVRMLSTIHESTEQDVKLDYTGKRLIIKPSCIQDYTLKMRGVDKNDQLSQYYYGNRRSNKYWVKMLFFFFNLILTNAYVLHKIYHTKRGTPENVKTHMNFVHSILETLLQEGQASATRLPRNYSNRADEVDQGDTRLTGRNHFPTKAYVRHSNKKSSKPCYLCKQVAKKTGDNSFRHWTSFECKTCKKPLCVGDRDCHEIYHTHWNCIDVAKEIATRIRNDVQIGNEEDPDGQIYDEEDPDGQIYDEEDPDGWIYDEEDPDGWIYDEEDPDGWIYDEDPDGQI